VCGLVRVFVAGGTGVLGLAAVRLLLTRGHEVVPSEEAKKR